jgi:hypothetical protein
MIFRRLFSVGCATLMMTSACNFHIDSTQETDAELFCRQAGFQLESAGYDDCLEASPNPDFPSPGEGETDTARLDDEQPEPSAADPKTATTAHATVSGSPKAYELGSTDRVTGSDQPSFAAHLSSVRSRARTGAEWTRLQQRFPSLLGEREAIVQSVELKDDGTYFRVMTGPFAAYAKAEGFCETLKSRQQFCQAMRLTAVQSPMANKPTVSQQPLLAAHLASVRAQSATETEWKRLQRRFPELLATREMIVRSVELEGKGTYFRVFTGPFADDGMAERFCAVLKSRQQYCLPTPL